MAKSLRDKLKKETLLLDGALGTYIMSLDLGKERLEGKMGGCLEHLSFSAPDLLTRLHADYLEAGADAVETNTFGANVIKLGEYGLSKKVFEINRTAVKIARKTADKFSTSSFPRYVIGTMGPTGKLPSSTDPSLGNVTYKELFKVYHDQAKGIISGGADAILVETGQDLLEMKAAFSGAKKAVQESRKDIVLMVQFTLANNGRMLLGTEASAVVAVFSRLGADVIGVNCSTGPLEMESVIEFLSRNSAPYISCIPNAGLPYEAGGKVCYPLGPAEMADILARFVKKYRIDVVGGCCGTNPEHIRLMRERIDLSPGKRRVGKKVLVSGFYKAFDLGEAKRPVVVGERINTQGSRKMKEMLLKEDYDGIVELGKDQMRKGADILDVCAILTERATEKRDAVILVKKISESVQLPLMIDSTEPAVVEAALSNYAGTMLINSINLEDGGKKAKEIITLAKEHGSSTIALLIDEKGMAKSLKRKMECAGKLYKLAAGKHGVEPERIIFDALTFSLGTGEEEYRNSAVDTFKAVAGIKKKFPGVFTILGVSNVSFGLPREGRRVLNAAYLHHAVSNGLDMAIINPAELVDYKSIPGEDRKAAEDLVLNRRKDALERFVKHFSGKKEEHVCREGKELPIEERLKNSVIERDKSIVIKLVDEALGKYKAEEIINGILLEAMREVGQKLDSGEFVLPYVLQSAEVMRAAIEHLEKFLPKGAKSAGEKRGKVLLATVFGDVHDIGKNLVKMILKNNGFAVIDLGKQVPVETIVREAKKNKVDVVGLSALLVSTAMHMKTAVQALAALGLHYPVIVGGAPINDLFAADISRLENKGIYKGGVFYARDAFAALSLAQALLGDATAKKQLMKKYRDSVQGASAFASSKKGLMATADRGREAQGARRTTHDARRKVPVPPFYGARSVSNIPVDDVFGHLDQKALFARSWGSKIKDEKKRAELVKKEYVPLLRELKEECLRKGWLELKAVYGYFKCSVSGNEMKVFGDDGALLEVFSFEQLRERTLAGYFKDEDLVAFQAVTVGGKISAAIKELEERTEYARVLYLHGLSVHLAEALAAYIHDRMRKELGLEPGQGKRYSPGYPLWKNLADQKKIFKILDVEKRIGVTLTEAFQMVPEQSTTAMVVYDEKAKY